MCDDYWDQDDARVVCNQLGFLGNVTAVQGGSFGQGLSSQPIWLDNVMCTGQEMYLSDCTSRGFGNHSCRHYEDAGVVCEGVCGMVFCVDAHNGQSIPIVRCVYV